MIMLRGGEVKGAVLLREQMRFRVGLGYLFACDAAGDEFILAEPGQRGECLRLCVYALLQKFPSWIVSIASRSDHSVDFGSGDYLSRHQQHREIPSGLVVEPGRNAQQVRVAHSPEPPVLRKKALQERHGISWRFVR